MDDLRDNKPMKKTPGRVSDSKDDMGSLFIRQEKSMSCRECGKGFRSWKALYGHMRCHPKRKRVFNSLDDDSWTNRKKNQKLLVMDIQSHNVAATDATLPLSSSSSGLEIDQEQIEAALTLMMLSRDVGHIFSVNAESSQTNSVVLEAQTRSFKRNPGKGDGVFYFSCDDNENLKSPKMKKLESVISKSGFLRVSHNKVQSKVSVDGFLRDDELIKRNLENGAGFVELGKGFSIEAELGEDSIEADSELGKYDQNSSKRSRSGDGSGSKKRNRFICRTCNKTFLSHQALGGHRSSYKKIKSCFSSRIKISENSIEKNDASADLIEEEQDGDINGVAEASCYESKKRCNLVGSSELRDNQTIIIQKEFPEIHHLLDLNLPPTEEE